MRDTQYNSFLIYIRDDQKEKLLQWRADNHITSISGLMRQLIDNLIEGEKDRKENA